MCAFPRRGGFLLVTRKDVQAHAGPRGREPLPGTGEGSDGTLRLWLRLRLRLHTLGLCREFVQGEVLVLSFVCLQASGHLLRLMKQ